ncbi:CoA transferase [Ktedonosporobacter rubrisoli]|uniref:CoA transferase n=1 Tax=Ktedonosporobacter rubrisoli TaxID=2509675 RepID=A0A4P6JR06_KTERU|nr:CoA transferase [Ktedonosporobacter rubrisoli]QBD77620.1 CoA transferase [Ktedonosporobacter rubrisoli]
MLPLQGIRVLDLSRVLSGPFCTMTLADLGAEVIKIERPGGDDTRHFAPLVKGESTYFLSINRNKKSVVVDMKTEQGQQIIWELLARSDVVVENFRPGTLERLGFGWEAIHERYPAVILASISGYGQTGPLASRPGYDLIAQGEGGLMDVTGDVGGPPVKVGFSVADIGTGMWAVIGILAALMTRAGTGQGNHVDVSLLETVTSWQTYFATAALIAGHHPQRLGSAHQGIAPYQSFEASDGYFNLAVGNDSLWPRFCDVLDGIYEGEKWYRLADYDTNNKRVQRRAELAEQLNAIFRAQPRHFWLELFQKAGIPAGSVDAIEEVARNPQLLARQMIEHVEHQVIGQMPVFHTPITFSNMERVSPVAPPLLGENTEEVLRGLGIVP